MFYYSINQKYPFQIPRAQKKKKINKSSSRKATDRVNLLKQIGLVKTMTAKCVPWCF
jgi:hypothetical protein